MPSTAPAHSVAQSPSGPQSATERWPARHSPSARRSLVPVVLVALRCSCHTPLLLPCDNRQLVADLLLHLDHVEVAEAFRQVSSARGHVGHQVAFPVSLLPRLFF